MSFLIGLTGPTGAGKTLVGSLLAQHNCDVIDCDEISRNIYLPNSSVVKKLAQRFGDEILQADGSVNRQSLAKRAFASPRDVVDLNAITHPEIMKIAFVRATKARQEGRHAILDAAALFESHGDVLCDFSIAVVAPAEIRLERILLRDDLSEQAARERMKAQKDDSFYIDRADYIVRNYPPYELADELRAIIERLREK